MTKTYRKVLKTIERQECIGSVCDGCGRDLPENYGNTDNDRRTFELKFDSGTGNPEGGFGTGWRVNDLCDDCVQRLRAALGTLGFAVEEYEWDY